MPQGGIHHGAPGGAGQRALGTSTARSLALQGPGHCSLGTRTVNKGGPAPCQPGGHRAALRGAPAPHHPAPQSLTVTFTQTDRHPLLGQPVLLLKSKDKAVRYSNLQQLVKQEAWPLTQAPGTGAACCPEHTLPANTATGARSSAGVRHTGSSRSPGSAAGPPWCSVYRN